ncbi:hypothetical protein L1049_028199 [Liquidambar formosana]|uniref:adenylate kinase n=1 Tax=Liquidambar formosana TaxID=63359 RepID=A0AAP0RM45_LIQFO
MTQSATMAAIHHLRTTATAGIPGMKMAAPPLMRLLRLTLSRFYGAAAAQPQFDHDYYDRNDCEPRSDGLSSAPMADSQGSIPMRGVQWVFIGNPSAKKHVFAEKLSKLLEVPHISMGCLVRQDLSPLSSLYKQIANAVNRGELVPEDIIFGLLSKRLEDGYDRGETGFILDGIPRSRIQAEILDQLADIDLVVNFKCTSDHLMENQESGIFSHCCESRGMSNLGSTSLDMPSCHTQPKFSTANTEGAWKEKHQVYAEQSKPLEDYYRKQKKLLDFQVGNAPGETWRGLLAALHIRHIAAAHYSQKLTPGSHWF